MIEKVFHGKRVDNGEWVEGYFYEFKISGCYILVPKLKIRKRDGVIIEDSFDAHEIDPETLGQFIGLIDKNGKKIWENDIVLCKYKKVNNNGEEIELKRCSLVDDISNPLVMEELKKCKDVEVVGNIFDDYYGRCD